MDMKVLMVDRDKEAVQELSRLLGEIHGGEIIACGSPSEAVFYLEEEEIRPDAAFIEVDLSPGSGIDLGSRIRQISPQTQIIFLSSADRFCQDVYRVDHVWLLRKPIDPQYLKKAWARVLDNLHARDKEIFVFEFRKVKHFLPCSQILYFENNERRILIHVQGEKEPRIFYGSMNELQTRLNENIFRCHESYIVNLERVDSHSRTRFTIDGHKIPISRKYIQEAGERIRRIRQRQGWGDPSLPIE